LFLGSVDILLFGDDAKIFKLFRSDDGKVLFATVSAI